MLPLSILLLFCLQICWLDSSLEKNIQSSHFLSCLSGFNSLVDDNSQLSVDSPTANQYLLSSAIDQQSLKCILTDLDVLDKARLLSCGMPHANAWIRALPVGTNMLSCLEWQICIKRWLGIAIFDSENLCTACGKQVMIMDVFGHHAVVCDCSRDRIKRHNAIKDWSLTPQSLALCNQNSSKILQSPKDLLAMNTPNQLSPFLQ